MRAVFMAAEGASGAGFVLALALHVWTLGGFRPLFEKYVWCLHFLLFILAIPGMWAVHILHRHLKGWAYWRSAFTGELCKETFRGLRNGPPNL